MERRKSLEKSSFITSSLKTEEQKITALCFSFEFCTFFDKFYLFFKHFMLNAWLYLVIFGHFWSLLSIRVHFLPISTIFYQFFIHFKSCFVYVHLDINILIIVENLCLPHSKLKKKQSTI